MDKKSRHLISIMNTPLSRRSMLSLMGLGASALSISGCSSAAKKVSGHESFKNVDISPIDRSLRGIGERKFSGDQSDLAHKILWDKQGYLASQGGLPNPTEKTSVAIIGGGLSGLFSAYLLRDLNPLLLERADRLGGNSKGESWDGLDYSIGAAYFMEPDKGSPLDGLLAELNLDQLYRIKTNEDPVEFKNRLHHGFWSGDAEPAKRKQYQKLHKYFKDVYEEKNGRFYPEIPTSDKDLLKKVKSLDRVSLTAHLESILGERLAPGIETALEHFCWSSLNASSSEVSAACGLNFYTGEFGKLLITPGGNAAVAERVLQRITNVVPRANVRTSSLVVDVKVVSDGVWVCYADAGGALKTVHAQVAVMACPKFVVNKILNEIEPKRLAAFQKLRYNAYLVANVLINKPIKDDFYDLFLMGDGRVDRRQIERSSDEQKVTDVVHGTYAKMDPVRSILTLYRGFPYQGGRPQLFAGDSYEKFRKEFETQINDSILGLVGASTKDVYDLRLTRWGHPLPVAQKGLIADGTVETIRKPFKERVYFVEQDNWMLPAFETSAEEALYWAPQIREHLKRLG